MFLYRLCARGLSILDTEDAKKNNAYGIAGISMFINS
ncbi:MAG: hypothetical protein CM15mP127_06800 [Gammaproteobacteria bacterium]|nr:MAG: hypothetical protein CM15mP127_06800 [Gammaproteobacteria bacterium]